MSSSALASTAVVEQGMVESRRPARRVIFGEPGHGWVGRIVRRPGEDPVYEELARRRRRAQIAARHALGTDAW